MKRHLSDGELRACLDGEGDSVQIQHLESCAACRERLHRVEAQAGSARRRLVFLAPETQGHVPNTAAAWSRLSRKIITQKETSMLKKWFAFPAVRVAVIAALVLALVLAVPGTRALAGQLLNLFRVQQVTVIPVDFTGLQQLNGNGPLSDQFTQLISSSMTVTQKPGDPVQVSDAKQASDLAGFSVRLPQGKTPSQIYVTGAAAATFTIDRSKAQALINEAGRSDLVLPESVDGARISVKVPATVSAGYGTCPKPHLDESQSAGPGIAGRRYRDCVILAQLPSPTVDAPADLDVAQLAQLGLQFTGMSAEEAAAFTKSVDWASTLVVPIPRNGASYEQVQVDGVTGTLIQRPADDAPQYALLWVKDGIIYAISGLGTDWQQAMEMANSLP
ncbi:MAG: anti-sigma factor family protein [Bacteroidota bacterium]